MKGTSKIELIRAKSELSEIRDNSRAVGKKSELKCKRPVSNQTIRILGDWDKEKIKVVGK